MITEAYSVTSLVEDMTAIIDARNVDKKVPIYYHIQENMPETLEGDAVRIYSRCDHQSKGTAVTRRYG